MKLFYYITHNKILNLFKQDTKYTDIIYKLKYTYIVQHGVSRNRQHVATVLTGFQAARQAGRAIKKTHTIQTHKFMIQHHRKM